MVSDAIEIRRLSVADIGLIGEIDRSEQINRLYKVVGGQLISEDVDLAVPTWDPVGTGEHSVASLIGYWEPVVAAGATFFGAFDGSALAGICIVDGSFEPGMAWLALLHVSRTYRGMGIASAMWAAAERVAKEGGATSMYVSSTSSNSAVGFYLSRGCELAGSKLNPVLYEMEPEDIHFICPVG